MLDFPEPYHTTPNLSVLMSSFRVLSKLKKMLIFVCVCAHARKHTYDMHAGHSQGKRRTSGDQFSPSSMGLKDETRAEGLLLSSLSHMSGNTPLRRKNYVFLSFVLFLETGFLHVALVVPELAL